ncbi:hypothetical protein ACFW04_003547 [Cataglyphis niger]
MKGCIQRDEEGKPIIDSNGFVTITCEEDNLVFQLHLSEIDEKAEQMCFNVNGRDVYIDVYPWEMVENDSENDKIEISEDDKINVPSTSKSGNAHFPWCDASTKIFLKEYKLKKELVRNRKLKNMKLAYQEISKSLQDNGFTVSPLQVENRFKTLKRAYKNMIIHNRRNGRGKYICSYEQDLDEIFSKNFLSDDSEMKGEEAIESENATFNAERIHNSGKNNEQYARLEAQHMKLIDNLQNYQRMMKNLITKTDNRNKTCNETQTKILQICMEMHETQKEAYARAEEQREKANLQREIRNNLLEEILTILKSRKET